MRAALSVEVMLLLVAVLAALYAIGNYTTETLRTVVRTDPYLIILGSSSKLSYAIEWVNSCNGCKTGVEFYVPHAGAIEIKNGVIEVRVYTDVLLRKEVPLEKNTVFTEGWYRVTLVNTGSGVEIV